MIFHNFFLKRMMSSISFFPFAQMGKVEFDARKSIKPERNSKTKFVFLTAIIFCIQMPLFSDVTAITVLHDALGEVAGYRLSSSLIFEKLSSSLSDEGTASLVQLHKRLEQKPFIKISIYGYSDSTCSDEANQILSLAHAQAVNSYLLHLGLPADRIDEVKGLGSSDPIADNSTEEGRRLNRRVELRFVGMTPMRAVIIPTQTSIPAEASATSEEPPRVSFGVGYPDLRLRARIWGGLDGEFKFAFDDAVQVYSGRIYYTFWKWWVFDFNVGAEVGFLNFSGIETLSGNGSFYEPFVGLRYKFNKYFNLTSEVGPAFINVSSGGVSFSNTDTIVTTAIYFYLF
jgi:hypothetical protein